MAELLVKAIDATSPDPEKDRHLYKRGMVVAVRADGHKWGRKEGLPLFVVIKVPDLSVEEAEAMYTREVQDEFFTQRMLKRRANAIDLDGLRLPEGPEGTLRISASELGALKRLVR